MLENTTDKFYNLMVDFNVIGFTLGVLIGNSLTNVANSIIDSIILPSMEPVLIRMGGKNMTIRVGGATFKLKPLVESLFKLLGLCLFIVIGIILGLNLSRPTQWVSIRSLAPGIKL